MTDDKNISPRQGYTKWSPPNQVAGFTGIPTTPEIVYLESASTAKPRRRRNRRTQAKKTTGKRVVSKAEYARIMARNAVLTTLSVALLTSGVLFGLCFIATALLTRRQIEPHLSGLFPGLLMGSVGFLVWGVRIKRKVESADVVQPATRKAVATLPAEDVLVRGSDTPQTPEAILLRAAQAQQIAPEQLLRAIE